MMEQKLDRFLLPTEEVHHKDENKLNDTYENFELWTTAQHALLHLAGKNFGKRESDYEKIEKLRKQGLGYKRIAKQLGYALSSVKSALKRGYMVSTSVEDQRPHAEDA